MNNVEINGAPWMTLGEQINYMCKLTNGCDEPTRPVD